MSDKLVRKKMRYHHWKITCAGQVDCKAWPEWVKDIFIHKTTPSSTEAILLDKEYYLVRRGQEPVRFEEGMYLVYCVYPDGKPRLSPVMLYQREVFKREFED